MRLRPLLGILAMLCLTAFADQPNSPTGRKVMLLSSAIAQGDVLAEAARDDVTVIRYETKTTTLDDLVTKVRKGLNGDIASSVAFVNHDYGENKFYLTKSETISLGSSLNSKEQQDFWKKMGAFVHPQGRIDLLACDLAKGDQGSMLISILERLTSRNVTASTNKTGNPGESTDWILESDAINADECYFMACTLRGFTEKLSDAKQTLTISDSSAGDKFGSSVSVFGNIAVVGAPGEKNGEYMGEGAAYIFCREEGSWNQKDRLTPGEDYAFSFGQVVSISDDTLVIGATGNYMSAQVLLYIYERDGDAWSEPTKRHVSSRGNQIKSLSISGDTLAVGYSYSVHGGYTGSVLSIYGRAGATWELQHEVDASENGGFANSLSLSDDTLLVYGDPDLPWWSDPVRGQVQVYVHRNGSWDLRETLTAMSDAFVGDNFGQHVSLSGNTAVVCSKGINANGESVGTAHIFVHDGDSWSKGEKISPVDIEEGDKISSVSLSPDALVIGTNKISNPGAAYVFVRNGKTWRQLSKLTAPNGEAGDMFGTSVTQSEQTIFVASHGDESNKGSVHVFAVPEVRKVMLLSSAVMPSEVLADAAKDEVIVIRYDAQTTSLDDLAREVREQLAGNVASSLAFVNNSYGENKFYLSKSETISLRSTMQSSLQQNFWKKIGALVVGDGRIDMLASGLAKGDQGNTLISKLEELSGRNVAASTDGTGNLDGSADWILETDEIDTSDCYFITSRLERFRGELASAEQEITASDRILNEGYYETFGGSVSISENVAVVGAYKVDGGRGEAYVFARDDGGTWIEQAKLTVFDGEERNHFGWSVSVSEDVALVGADWDDSAYVFTRVVNETGQVTWDGAEKLTVSNGANPDGFGCSLSISGNTALVGASRDGSAYVFTRAVNAAGQVAWAETAKLTAFDGAMSNSFGYSVSMSDNIALVGTDGDGSAYVFTRVVNETGQVTWEETTKLTPAERAEHDRFGYSVSVSGNVALVGSNEYDGAMAHVFTRIVNATGQVRWDETAKLTPANAIKFGSNVSISGDTAVIGAWSDEDNGHNSGAAYVFVQRDGDWIEQAKLAALDGAEDDEFGRSVSVFGDTVLVGAFDRYEGSMFGSAYMFSSPRIASTTEPSNITSKAADSGGEVVTSVQKIIERGVAYGRNFPPTIDDHKLPDREFNPETHTGGGEFISHLEELVPDTTYYVRAYVTTAGGTSYGEMREFKTLALHTVEANVNDPAGGTIKVGSEEPSTSNSVTIDHDKSLPTLLAQPALGYYFKNWTKDGEEYSPDAELTISNVTEDMILEAVFMREQNIRITDGETEIANGDLDPSTEDHTDFGNVNLHAAPKEWNFVITNTGTLDLTIENIIVEVAPNEFSGFAVTNITTPLTIIPNAREMFKVSFNPTTEGSHKATIKVFSDDPDPRVYSFVVRGKGVVGKLEAVKEVVGDPDFEVLDAIEFGTDSYAGSSVEQTVTIRNTGSDTMSLDAFSFEDGPHNDYFSFNSSNTDATLEAEQETQLTISYTPLLTGTHSAQLIIEGTNGAQPETSIAINGSAILPKPTGKAVVDGNLVTLSVSDYNSGSIPEKALKFSWAWKSGPTTPPKFENGPKEGKEVEWISTKDGLYIFTLTVQEGDNSESTDVLAMVGNPFELEIEPTDIIKEGENKTLTCTLTSKMASSETLKIRIGLTQPTYQIVPPEPDTLDWAEKSPPLEFYLKLDNNDSAEAKETIRITLFIVMPDEQEEEIVFQDVTIYDDDGPKILVRGEGNIVIEDGHDSDDDGTLFAKPVSSGGSEDQEFTIWNQGTEDLNLTGDPEELVTITGTDPQDFEVVAYPDTPIRPTEKSTFTIRFKPTGEKPKPRAIVTIPNDDKDFEDFYFHVKGEASGISSEDGGSEGGCTVGNGQHGSSGLLTLLVILVSSLTVLRLRVKCTN